MITDKIDRITHIPESYLRPDPPCPKSVKIELTGRCNYACGFCALRMREKQPKLRDDMELEFFKKITRDMFESGVEEIGLFYLGESLMAPELTIQATRFLKEELGMPYVFLTTNGSLATIAVVDGLMAAGLDSLKFSINAADEVLFGSGNRLYVATGSDLYRVQGYPTMYVLDEEGRVVAKDLRGQKLDNRSPATTLASKRVGGTSF